jgi:DNA-binding protein HU-beta
MAKKDKQAKKDKAGGGAADAVDAIRSAIERGLEGAGLNEKRQREVVDQVTGAAGRIRQTLEDLRVVDEVKDLRAQVERLAARVAELEGAARTRATGTSRAGTSRAGASRSTASRASGTSSRGSTTRAKSGGTGSGSSGTRAKPGGTSSRSTSSRSSSSRARPKSSGSGS